MTPSQSLFSLLFQNTVWVIVAEALDTLLIQGTIYAYTIMFNDCFTDFCVYYHVTVYYKLQNKQDEI
jgi:hypothetical protein